MPQDIQALLATLGFTSTWSTMFHLLAYTGLLISTWGILDKKRQAWLFLVGITMLWLFAIFGGNPIFMGTQSIITAASLMRVRRIADAAAITVVISVLVFAVMARRGDFGSGLELVGALAMLGLAFGVAFAPRLIGNTFLALGGGLMALYSYEVWSLPFFLLNIPFTLAALWVVIRYPFNKQSV